MCKDREEMLNVCSACLKIKSQDEWGVNQTEPQALEPGSITTG